MATELNIGTEQKAAALVIALGTDKASKLYKYLSDEDVEKLTLEVAKLGHLEAEQTEAVLDDFYKMCLTQKVVTDGGLEYAFLRRLTVKIPLRSCCKKLPSI